MSEIDATRHISEKISLRRLTNLREKVPGVVIRTSLIVGFPGETEEQFEELCAVCSGLSAR